VGVILERGMNLQEFLNNERLMVNYNNDSIYILSVVDIQFDITNA